ncbi:T4 family baseplate hub assembly chaperone [Calothrix sp. NIES-2098]|uniref:T4 family baseplate hub assembly chaperone n=1 Tax=Calothrix sp. NIES-2098 TaxID=1954171 RepID=UPI000B6026E7|nr:hypothetical protein NIES2098_25430 [Calothrix sp. NIES-2098]
MRPLSADYILRIWEIGQSQHPIDRALTLLAFACPEKTTDELASLTIGQRDAYLLTLREISLGPRLNGFTECPKCGERLEFDLNVSDIRISEPSKTVVHNHTLKLEAWELQFRLPNSLDLAAIADCQDVAAADSLLLQRCLLQANHNGTPVSCDRLSPEVINQLAEQMAEADPQAEILLNLNCSACGHEWQSLFDILSFFWTEITAQAKRLLREVHLLARFYGWREADILSMSAFRRQLYLDLVTDG